MTFGRCAPAGYAINASVVDDGIHSANCIDLFGDPLRIDSSAKVSEHDAERFLCQISESIGALAERACKTTS